MGTKEIEAIGCKITDSLEVGIADEDGQVTIDPINGMDDLGVIITHSTDKNRTTRNSMDTMVTTNGLPMVITDKNVSSFW